jgi:hypothetical protein
MVVPRDCYVYGCRLRGEGEILGLVTTSYMRHPDRINETMEKHLAAFAERTGCDKCERYDPTLFYRAAAKATWG